MSTMTQCFKCKKKVTSAFLCDKCDQIHCKDCKAQKCLSCGNSQFIKVVIETQSFSNDKVDWYILTDGSKIGLSYFTEIPSFLISLIKTNLPKKLKERNINPILFPQKSCVNKFLKSLSEHYKEHRIRGLPHPEEKSRYTILRILDDVYDEKFMLINTLTLAEKELEFIVNFCLQYFIIFDKILKEDSSSLRETYYQTISDYNSKMNIDFVSFNEDDDENIGSFISAVKSVYSEYLALKNCFDVNDDKQIIDFIKRKIELVEKILPDTKLYDLFDVYRFSIDIFLRLESCRNLSKLNIASANYTKSRLEKLNDDFETKFNINIPMKKISKVFKENFSVTSFENFNNFSHSLSNSLLETIKIIEPKYKRLQEINDLWGEVFEIDEFLETNPHEFTPNLPEIIDFYNKLKSIYETKNINIEMKIYIRKMMFNLVERLARKDEDENLFETTIEIGAELSELIIENLSTIKKLDPKITLDYFDVIQTYMVLSELSWRYKDFKKFTMFRNISLEKAMEYDIKQFQAILWWQEFTITDDYDSLVKAYRYMEKDGFRDYIKDDNRCQIIFNTVKAIVEKKDKTKNFLIAINEAQKIYVHPISLWKDVISGNVMLHFSKLMYSVSMALEEQTNYQLTLRINEIIQESNVLEKLSPIPFGGCVPWLKGKIVYHLSKKDVSKVEDLLKKLSKYVEDYIQCGEEKFSSLKDFITLTSKWMDLEKENKSYKKMIMTLETIENERDLFSRVAVKIIRNNIKNELFDYIKEIEDVKGKRYYRGLASFYKGKFLEMIVALVYRWRDFDYTEFSFILPDGTNREIDLICIDNKNKKIVVVDVKNKEESYGTKFASDFSKKFFDLLSTSGKEIPQLKDKNFDIKASIYSRTKITEPAMKILKKDFGNALEETMCDKELETLLQKYNLSLPKIKK